MAGRVDLRRSAIHLSIINASQVALGFVFHILLGRRFGISWELDCLFISLLIFNFFGIFNNLIISLLTPFFNDIKSKSEKDAFEFADVVFKWSISLGIIGWFLILNYSPLIVRLFASGFNERAVNLSTEILNILFIGYIFNNLSISISMVLKSLYFFLIPAAAGLLNPIFNIGAIFILTPGYGIKGIAIASVLSNILYAIITAFHLFLKTRWRPTLKVYHNRLFDLFRQSFTAVAGGFIWSLRDIISRNIASHLGSGAIALLSYADKIISILSQIIITPVSSIFYSKVSEIIASLKFLEVKNLLLKVMKVNVSIAVFAGAGVIVFLKPLLNILFLDSRFTSRDIDVLFYLLLIELAILIIFSFETLFVRIVYALKKTGVVLFVAFIGIALFYILSKTLSNLFNLYGLALSISITQIFVCGLYFYSIKKYITVSSGNIFHPVIKNLMLAIPLITAGLVVNSIIKNNMLILFISYPIWTIIYWTISRYILKEEWNILLNRSR